MQEGWAAVLKDPALASSFLTTPVSQLATNKHLKGGFGRKQVQ